MKQSDFSPMNLKQLAALYNVSSKTMANWLLPFKDKIGIRMGYTYTPKQIRVIFDSLGKP